MRATSARQLKLQLVERLRPTDVVPSRLLKAASAAQAAAAAAGPTATPAAQRAPREQTLAQQLLARQAAQPDTWPANLRIEPHTPSKELYWNVSGARG
jgi:hypothetical protein